MILQGMKNFKLVYINTVVGLFINILLDIPMILLFNKTGILPPYLGTLTATNIGLFISELIIAIALRKQFKFKYKSIIITMLKSLFATAIMVIVLFFVKKFIFVTEIHRLLLIGELGLIGLFGIGMYLLISNQTGLINEVLGQDILKKILSKFRIGKKNKDK